MVWSPIRRGHLQPSGRGAVNIQRRAGLTLLGLIVGEAAADELEAAYLPRRSNNTAGRLSRTNLPPSLVLPVGVAPAPGIVHLGLGNFARAHTAVYTAAAIAEETGPWGVVGVAQHSHAVADALVAQDLLYTVLTLAPGGVEAAVSAVLAEVLVAADSPDELLAHLASPTTRIVTLTVTEKGYSYSPATLGLDLDDPAVRADLRGGPPRTVIAQIVRGLQRRAQTHAEPITVLSCDNLASNGEHTRRLVYEFVAALPSDESDGLAAWLETAVTFPSTMVDRIVPATTPAHRRLVADTLGVADEVPVPTEPFSMWVLQDRFAAGRPAWEAAGAIFTDDVHGYELLKLRLLNGTHSLIAYLGMLAGRRYIAEAVRMPAIERAARALIADDYLPTLTVPEGVDLSLYIEQLFQRFGNTAIAHPTTQVGSDGSLKLPIRITDAAQHHLDRGAVPRGIALMVAAYIACLATPHSYDTRTVGTVRDPAAVRLAELGARHAEPRQLTRAVFSEAGIFSSELADRQPFLDAVTDSLATLRRHGVAAAVNQALVD